jgi:hypothetical protein
MMTIILKRYLGNGDTNPVKVVLKEIMSLVPRSQRPKKGMKPT